MLTDILLFGYISSYNAVYFFEQIKEALMSNPDQDLMLRINSEGGNPDYTQMMVDKVQDISAQAYIKAGSSLHSAAFFFLCYVDPSRVECFYETQACMHRAAYPEWMEKSEGFAASSAGIGLAKTNKDLEKAVRARVDVDAMESLPQFKDRNLTLKDVFSMEARHDIMFTGADLKKLGLVGKVKKLIPQQEAFMAADTTQISKAASFKEVKMAVDAIVKPEATKDKNQIDNTIMDLNKLKTEFPGVYAQAKAEGIAEGRAAGVTAEKDRVEAIMVYADVDLPGVTAAIAAGTSLSAKQMAEFTRKAISAEALKDASGDSTPIVTTGEAKEKGKEKTAAFETELNTYLGLTTK